MVFFTNRVNRAAIGVQKGCGLARCCARQPPFLGLINLEAALETPSDGPSFADASICGLGTYHPLGETRRSWKPVEL
jgi:hypothetical protein